MRRSACAKACDPMMKSAGNASALVARFFVAALRTVQTAGRPQAIRVVETQSRRPCLYPPESCSQRIPWPWDRPVTPRRLARLQLNRHQSLHCRGSSQYLRLGVPWTKGRKARWYRLPFSLFLSFVVAQGLDPGICLMHPGKGGQRTHIFREWIFRWARRADGCSVILNDKFHAISLFQPEAIAGLTRYGDLSLTANCARTRPWPLSLSYHLFSDIHENRMEIRDFCHLTCFNCLSRFVRLGLISALDRHQRHQERSLRHTPDCPPQIAIQQWH